MPIRKENIGRYPKDWKKIRERILTRAHNKCEWCGAPNHLPHFQTGSMVVLTIMHLDHQPENCDDSNLKAACQKCHNSYDMPARVQGVRNRRREKIMKTQTSFDFEGNK